MITRDRMREPLEQQLFEAIEEENFVGVRDVVKKGTSDPEIKFDINIGDISGCPALAYAAESKSPDALAMVKYLIEHGADVNKRNGWTLKNAVMSSNPDAPLIVRYLVEHGADISVCRANTLWGIVRSLKSTALPIVKYLVEQGIDVNFEDGKGNSALSNAVLSENPDALKIVELLVGHGADVNAQNGEALRRCIQHRYHNAFSIARHLVEHGAKLRWDHLDIRTAFALAVVYNPHIAEYLLHRDDFLPSDIIPFPSQFPPNIYDVKKVISHVSESLERRGSSYIMAIAADIREILESTSPRPKQQDIEMLEILAKKISSIDLVRDAVVSSSDFEDIVAGLTP